ncbi:hypothetical protein H5410_011677 [Solanum commersonii]|uniref:Zinc finger GRF-type domain-containing protein n=1 Tax=Solanum commersonii TaxID=4109 RepID=A0A9J6AQC6_SOLCO|nr:hypothetical protein H5410_011677 [Solanum commersonii]
MTVRCCYCGIYVELKTLGTPTNPEKIFWGCQKYASDNGYGFFRWTDANDSTCQEQYNIKNPSTSLGKERQAKHRRQRRQRRQGSHTTLVGLPPDAKAVAGLTPLDEAFVGLLALIRLALGVQPALGPAFILDWLLAVATLVPAVAIFYKHILKSKIA